MTPSKQHVVYILANIDKAIAFEWIAEFLDAQRFELSFIIIGAKPGYLYHYLQEKGVTVAYISMKSRRQLPRVTLKVWQLLRRWKPDVVHTHLLEANLAGLTAAWLAGVSRRIHTRHHATFHHEYAPQGVRWDQISNRLSTQIVAISENVHRVLEDYEGVAPGKLVRIPHGFDMEAFQAVEAGRVQALQQKYGLEQVEGPVIGVVARYMRLKGIQYIIPAFQAFQQQYPTAHLLLAGAKGPDAKEIRQQLDKLPRGSYTEITFEPDLFGLYQLMDMFIHVPTNERIEAFGQIYIEALAAGLPSIFSLSGVAPEVVRHEHNALTVPFEDSNAIYEAMLRLWKSPELRCQLGRQGRHDVVQAFNLSRYIQRIEALYEN